MKAKRVYEFKRTRKKGLSDQTEIGLETFAKKEIKDWIDKYTNVLKRDEITYEILKNENSNSENNYIVNFTVQENKKNQILFIFLEDNNIPFDIKTNAIIEIYNTTKNPSKILNINIQSTRYLYINFDDNLEKLIGNIEVNELIINDSTLKELPENLIINILDTSSIPSITHFPDNLTVKERLHIDDESNCRTIGKNLKAFEIEVKSFSFKEFSEGTECNYLYIYKSSILDELPDDIKINKRLEIYKYGAAMIPMPKSLINNPNAKIFEDDDYYIINL